MDVEKDMGNDEECNEGSYLVRSCDMLTCKE